MKRNNNIINTRLARKFVWVFHNIVWKIPNKLTGQPNNEIIQYVESRLRLGGNTEQEKVEKGKSEGGSPGCNYRVVTVEEGQNQPFTLKELLSVLSVENRMEVLKDEPERR